MKIYNKYVFLIGMVMLIEITIALFYRPLLGKYGGYMNALNALLFVTFLISIRKKAGRRHVR